MRNNEFFDVSDVLRSSDVYRWHAVKTLRQQSNAEHQFLVAWIGDIISKRIYPDMTEREELALMRYNLGHDIPEVLLGDICSPVKRILDKHFEGEENPLDVLEYEVCPGYKQLKASVEGNPLRRIGKIADLIEMIIFIRAEGVGPYAKTIEENLLKGLKEVVDSSYEKYPSLNWKEGLNLLDEVKNSQGGNHLEFDWNATALS